LLQTWLFKPFEAYLLPAVVLVKHKSRLRTGFAGRRALVGVKILISSDNGKIQLSIKNSISQNVKSSHGSGIGIKNVKHRLDIIYPGKHELIIDEQSEFFSVDLIIET